MKALARWRALARQSRLALDTMRAERDALALSAREERQALLAERERSAEYATEIERLRAERIEPGALRAAAAAMQALGIERDTLRGKLDTMRAKLDTMRAERDALRVALDTMRARLERVRELGLAREIALHRAPAPEGRGTCARCSCACTLDGGLCHVCARAEQGGA